MLKSMPQDTPPILVLALVLALVVVLCSPFAPSLSFQAARACGGLSSPLATMAAIATHSWSELRCFSH